MSKKLGVVLIGSIVLATIAVAFQSRSTAGEPIEVTSDQTPVATPSTKREIAVFAGGCFWGVEYYFLKEKGVKRVTSGYTGGHVANPTYDDVLTKRSGHLEAVEVEFDPTETDFETMARLFFEIHDPTQTDGQGADIGPQYLSAIFYQNDQQRQISQRLIGLLEQKGLKIATELKPAKRFWRAEEYHQRYYEKNGGTPYCHVKVKRF